MKGDTAAQAIGLFVRDMPRVPGDWTEVHLTPKQYRRLMGEVAYTIASLSEQDVRELVDEAPYRIARGGDLSDLDPKACSGRLPWWRRWMMALGVSS